MPDCDGSTGTFINKSMIRNGLDDAPGIADQAVSVELLNPHSLFSLLQLYCS